MNQSIKDTNVNIGSTNFLEEFPEDELLEDFNDVEDSNKKLSDQEISKIFTN